MENISYLLVKQTKINTLIQRSFQMAKVIEELVVVRFSKIVKDTEKNKTLVSAELMQTLEQVVQEIAGEAILVEVIKE